MVWPLKRLQSTSLHVISRALKMTCGDEMAADGQARKRGGQPKSDGDRKRNNLTFRARDELREKIQASALKYGRSASEEIEHRLELSFAQIDQLQNEWGEDYYRIAANIAGSLSYIEDFYGCKWHESETASDVFKKTAATIIQNARDHYARIERDRLSGTARDLTSLPVEEQANWFAGLGGSNPPFKRRKPVEVVVTDE